MSNVVDFDTLRHAYFDLHRRIGITEARKLLKAHGGGTTVDTVPEEMRDALFGALSAAGFNADLKERTQRSASAMDDHDDDDKPEVDPRTEQLNQLAKQTYAKRKADAAKRKPKS
jgi:hypothetical protein